MVHLLCTQRVIFLFLALGILNQAVPSHPIVTSRPTLADSSSSYLEMVLVDRANRVVAISWLVVPKVVNVEIYASLGPLRILPFSDPSLARVGTEAEGREHGIPHFFDDRVVSYLTVLGTSGRVVDIAQREDLTTDGVLLSAMEAPPGRANTA